MSQNHKYSILSKIYNIFEKNKSLENRDEVPVIKFKSPEDLNIIFNKFECTNEKPTSETEIINILEKVVKFSVNPTHTNYHNEFFAGPDPYALAATWLSEALNSCQYTFEAAPVFTLAERAMIQHGLKLFGYETGDGLFAPGGSMGNMYGIILARYMKYPDVKTRGLTHIPQLVAFTSEDVSINKK